jgi:hypothetical protein
MRQILDLSPVHESAIQQVALLLLDNKHLSLDVQVFRRLPDKRD